MAADLIFKKIFRRDGSKPSSSSISSAKAQPVLVL